MTANKNICT